MAKTTSYDLLHGPLLPKILAFALPLAATSILQQLFNVADYAVVGLYCGSQSLAAVGSNGSLINMLVTFFVGLTVGTNVVISRSIGQKNEEAVSRAVHTCVLLGIIAGCVLVPIGLVFAPKLLVLMSCPEDVIGLASVYLRIYFCGMPVIMLYNFGSAILRSAGDTRRPLIALASGGVINIFLNLFTVIVLKMDVAGVALATVISNGFSAFLVLRYLVRETGPLKLEWKKLKLHRNIVSDVLRIGLAAGLQGLVFSLSNVVVQSSINSFGSLVIAGCAASANCDNITYFFINGFIQAGTTFTSQCYGAGDVARCKEVYRKTLLCSLAVSGACCLFFTLFCPVFMLLFTRDPEVISYAVIRQRWTQSPQFLINFYEIPGACLRGFGSALLPAALCVLGICVFRISYIGTVFASHRTLQTLFAVYPLSWLITGPAVMAAYYIVRRKKFAQFGR